MNTKQFCRHRRHESRPAGSTGQTDPPNPYVDADLTNQEQSLYESGHLVRFSRHSAQQPLAGGSSA